MEKINCNVIQDILPLYIDDVVSDDTKELVEEHLQNCEICQRVYHETKTDLENDMKISAQTKESSNEANDLKSFRKFLKKRKIKTILLSIAATVICFVAVFTFMNKHVTYISYKDAGITIVEDNKDEVKYKTNIKGNYRWSTSLDRKTGVMTIHFEQSLWEKYVSCIFYPYDHIHDILKKDEIKEVMNDRKNRRVVSQPLDKPSAGSVFRNPPGMSAGKLIEDAGLKGYIHGGAMISDKHANFIINNGTATYEDIIMLIDYIKERIKVIYDIDLILEQEIIR